MNIDQLNAEYPLEETLASLCSEEFLGPDEDREGLAARLKEQVALAIGGQLRTIRKHFWAPDSIPDKRGVLERIPRTPRAVARRFADEQASVSKTVVSFDPHGELLAHGAEKAFVDFSRQLTSLEKFQNEGQLEEFLLGARSNESPEDAFGPVLAAMLFPEDESLFHAVASELVSGSDSELRIAPSFDFDDWARVLASQGHERFTELLVSKPPEVR